MRPDGSVRKEIKVKPGYKPPEDVEVYKNRTAAAWKDRGKGGVPGAEAIESEGSSIGNAAAVKNAKRREARRKAAAAGGNGEDANAGGEGQRKEEEEGEAVDPEVEKAKDAKKLAKKLRQARELQEKKQNGDNLLPEQFAKVIKMNELIRQLDALGFDADGEKKTLHDSKGAVKDENSKVETTG
jgi:partner of Y14 and mago protein